MGGGGLNFNICHIFYRFWWTYEMILNVGYDADEHDYLHFISHGVGRKGNEREGGGSGAPWQLRPLLR